jgi:hypothetical protein
MAALLGAVAPFRGHLLVNAWPGRGSPPWWSSSTRCSRRWPATSSTASPKPACATTWPAWPGRCCWTRRRRAPGTHGPGPVERALELLRRMSTGKGGTRKQGDIGGGTVTQTAVGAVLLAAINPAEAGAGRRQPDRGGAAVAAGPTWRGARGQRRAGRPAGGDRAKARRAGPGAAGPGAQGRLALPGRRGRAVGRPGQGRARIRAPATWWPCWRPGEGCCCSTSR